MENSERLFQKSSSSVYIRSLMFNDLSQTAVVHSAAFPKSALTHLGKESIRRYYAWQLTGPHDCLAIGAFDDDGRLLGFCFGGIFRGALSGFVQKNKMYLVIQVLKRPWLIVTNSIFRDRLKLGIRVRNKPKTIKAISSTHPTNRSFGILSIAVDPSLQGLGIGQKLMRYSEDYARERGFKEMGLTVAVDNEQAICFYEKGGWKKISTAAGWKGSMTKVL